MTAIQIITFETERYITRVMIEEFSHNYFRVYSSIRLKEDEIDTIFTPFELSHDKSALFLSPKDALAKVIQTQLKDEKIIEINSQISDLLTSEEIMNITKVTNIIES